MHLHDEDPLDDQALNLTSMTDLVFLMLVFFLCATTFLERERALELELPRASHAQAPREALDEIVIDVARDGSLMIGGRTLARETLAAELRRIAGRGAETPVTIRGDRRAHHEAIVAVMDACGAAGLRNLSVGTLEGS